MSSAGLANWRHVYAARRHVCSKLGCLLSHSYFFFLNDEGVNASEE